MTKKLLIALFALLFTAPAAYADVLHIKKLNISFEGKHIKDDLNDVHFGVNFFVKSGKTLERLELVLPKSNVSYEIVSISTEETDETNIEKLINEADLWIYTNTPEKAYQKYHRARKLVQNAEKNKEEIDDGIKKQINSGILRFELVSYLKNFASLEKRKKKLERVKEFSNTFHIFKEYQEFLLVKTLQILKSYEYEIQNLMQLALKIKRHQFFELLDKEISNSKAAKAKHQQELQTLYNQIQSIYRAPYETPSIVALYEFMQTKPEHLAKLLKKANLSETILEIASSAKAKEFVNKFAGNELITNVRSLAEIVFTEKKISTKNLEKRMKYFEELYKKLVSFDQVGKIINADIFTFKSENENEFKDSLAVLSEVEKQLYESINSFREDLGLNPLFLKDKTLKVAADKYIRELAKMKIISHTGNDGSTPETRAKNAGWKGKHVGENLYRGSKETNMPNDVITAWFQSIAHLKNLASKHFDSCGIAKAGYNWCAIFGGP